MELLSFSDNGWGRQLVEGAWLTIRLAGATLPFGIFLGLLLAFAITGKNRMLAKIAVGFTTIFKALPELLTIFIIYYGSQFAFQSALNVFFSGVKVEIPAFVAGMAALGVVFASFAAEIFVASTNAVPKGQYEAASAIGLSSSDAWWSVIFPQMWRLALPGLGNLWFVLLKDTALVSAIALSDLMRQTSIAVANTKQPIFFYVVACAIYLVMSLVSSGVIRLMETRANAAYVGAR
ncbi:ABC transporter permease [Agrobacterium rosae]|uniref:ABC transporter permease n=1 Tax=Agrobacterium rosae TaxID=1972867 RepID=UPI002033D959|nr:ABC transporter permease subunit [Agrobacterium rosae]MCM2435770.1 ABC transporter permease subunit [Agrobacterium rosae]